MKHLIKLLWISGLALGLAAITVRAQVAANISLDENGHGSFNGVAFTGALVPVDPSGGVAGPVLLYTVPAAAGQLTIGDVRIIETGTTNTSDQIRFWSNNTVIFYSGREAGETNFDLADTSGLPNVLLPNAPAVVETGVEGNNFALYTPLIGPGGSNPGANGNPATTYSFISDVPEPSTVILAGLSGGLLLLARWRRRRLYLTGTRC